MTEYLQMGEFFNRMDRMPLQWKKKKQLARDICIAYHSYMANLSYHGPTTGPLTRIELKDSFRVEAEALKKLLKLEKFDSEKELIDALKEVKEADHHTKVKVIQFYEVKFKKKEEKLKSYSPSCFLSNEIPPYPELLDSFI